MLVKTLLIVFAIGVLQAVYVEVSVSCRLRNFNNVLTEKVINCGLSRPVCHRIRLIGLLINILILRYLPHQLNGYRTTPCRFCVSLCESDDLYSKAFILIL